MRSESRQRLDELLLARALEELRDAEALELERLLAAHPDVDAGAYERAAAAVCLATLKASGAMPRRLRSSLEKRAAELMSGSAGKDGPRA